MTATKDFGEGRLLLTPLSGRSFRWFSRQQAKLLEIGQLLLVLVTAALLLNAGSLGVGRFGRRHGKQDGVPGRKRRRRQWGELELSTKW